jgi:nuclear pore complex protein Nup133
MTKFQGRGFGEFVCKWYAERGMRGHLLGARFVSQPSLKKFLHSGENRFMSWLHDVDAGDYYGAHRALLDLAISETKYLTKKKTLLALSKLAALASDRTPADLDLDTTLSAIQREQELILHQEQLPCIVVESLAMNTDSMHVLSVVELIESLISGDVNPSANENDFKKALDLTSYADHEKLDIGELRLRIWSQAALRNDWVLVGSADPIAICKDTVFFKTVALCDDKSVVPSVEELLLTEELDSLRKVPTFEFLLRAGYEYFNRQL